MTLLLEVTERGGDDWTPAHEAAASQLTARGIQLGLDDYGTGFSRLSFLQPRRWDMIKFDRRSVRASSTGNAVVAHLAEGIETAGRAISSGAPSG